ncbi:carbamoyl-phosphate synthase subunit L [Oscillibacter sp.]|uniref:carbamoyl-phosphate synthase subunit L n=1 Tax=Oscillibacter sp. TaxID=1945593 RepID=UPI0028AD5AE5|nr:carbamoyl-phosphate synthase subunit L [Oscillibacter sp.]
MGDLEQFVKTVVEKQYPHLKRPAVVYASVTAAQMLSDTYTLTNLQITNTDSSTSFNGSIKAHWFEYSLRVLDQFGNEDESYPEIPAVRSKLQLNTGATVAVGYAFNTVEPVIIGEVVL